MEKKRTKMMMVCFFYTDDDDSKDLAVIEDEAVGAPEENQGEPKKKVKIVNFVRKTAQVPALMQVKANENSSTRKETKKSSDKGKSMKQNALIKRPPRTRQKPKDITSKSVEHSFKSGSQRTAHRSLHSTAFKSIAAGSFILEASVPEDYLPIPPPIVLPKKVRREKSIFENDESYEESMRGIMIDETKQKQAIIEEAGTEGEGKSTKEKKKTKIRPEATAEEERKKLTGIEEVGLNNKGK